MITAYAIPGIKIVPMPPAHDKLITVEIVEQIVSSFFEVPLDKIKMMKRTRVLVDCRCIIFYLLRKHTKMTISAIGKLYGKDHTTAIHGLQSCSNLMETDEYFRANVQVIERLLIDKAPSKLTKVMP